MPHKSFKDLHFKTAEQIKLNTKRLQCKVCGKKMRGKSTLSRHISHAHNNIDPVKREKMVIDAYFGQSKVDDAIRKYKSRIYNLSTIPIDISRYIALAEIEQDEPDEKRKITRDQVKRLKVDKIEIPKNYSVIEVVDSSENEAADVKFADNIFYDFEDGKLKMNITETLDKAIPFILVKAFIKKLSLEDSIIYISLPDGSTKPIKNIEIKSDEEIGKDRIQCTVTYSSNSSKEKTEDK